MSDLGAGMLAGAFIAAMLALSFGVPMLRESERVCRHAIQANFSKTRQEAEQILERQRAWERE